MSCSQCCVCFKEKAQKIRQCYCTYCNICYQKSENGCGCGGHNEFKAITDDIKHFLEFRGNFTQYYFEKINQIYSSIRQFIDFNTSSAENIKSIRDHQKEINRIKMFHRIRQLEEEKRQLINKGKTHDLNFSIEHRDCFNDDSKKDQKHDFSPFEGLWGRLNRFE